MAEYPVYTKASMLTEIRTTIEEPTALFWSDTEINMWIDRGARKASQLTLCIPDKDTITTAASVYGYTLAIPFIKVESVIYNNVGLQRIDIRNFGHGGATQATGTAPKQYYHIGQRIYLWPSPAISLSVYVHGYRSAIAYSDATDTTPTKYEIPNVLQPTVMDFALACAYTKAGKHSLVSYHMNKFLKECQTYRRDIHDRALIPDSLDRFHVPDRTVSAQS